MSQYEEIQSQCVDCDQEFTITSGEQEFYAEKGLNLPKRCKECRAAKKKRNMRQNRDRRDGGGDLDY